MLKLPWGFYKDAWLIDPMPDTFEIRVEEHPQGIILNPKSITLYFGANPIYLWGTGKLYHEVIFSEQGFLILPFFMGRPGFEFIESINYNFAEQYDWLGEPITERNVGRVLIDKATKDYLKKFYHIGYLTDKELVTQKTPSSALVKIDDSQLEKQYTVGYTPIYTDVDKFKEYNNVISMIPMTLNNNQELIDVIDNSIVEYQTPYDRLYTQQGIYEKVISLKTVKVDITSKLKKMFEDNTGFQICFKTLIGFREGILIDYGSTQYSDKKNYGFRLSVYKDYISLIINSGNEFTHLEIPVTLSFIRTNAFFLKVKYNDYVELRINDETFHYNFTFLKPKFNENDIGYLSGASLSKLNVQTGDIAELGLFGFKVDDEFKDKYLEMEPILPYPGIPAVEDTLVPVIDDLTYSVPPEIILPKGFNSKTDWNYVNPYNKLYLGNTNSEIQTTELEDAAEGPYMKTIIPVGWNIYKAIGNPDVNFDDKTDFIFLIKKLTSDIHIPLKIDINFKLPKWWKKDMRLNIKLKMIPIGATLWYSYTKYRTGEWF